MIVSVGEILVDQFVSEDKVEKFPGGAPFNVACNIKQFGGNISFIGSLGKDENGYFLKQVARRRKFDQLILNYPKGRDTTVALVTLTNGERSFKFIRENGADYVFSLAKFKKLNISKGDIVHVGSLMLSESRGISFANKVIEYVRNKGGIISFDVNYRDDIFYSAIKAKNIYKKILKKSDIVKISSDELNVLSKYKKLGNQLNDLFDPNQLVFVSRGSKGSALYYQYKLICVESITVVPLDTTGAGDAFYSFVLYSLDGNLDKISNDKFIKETLLKANIVGALATLKKGAIDVVPSLDEIAKYF